MNCSMPLSEPTVLSALQQVFDPELGVNVVDLGLIYEVVVEPSGDRTDIRVKMTLTSPACPFGPRLIQEIKDVLGGLEGAGAVDVRLALSPPWTPERMSEDARDQLGLF